MKYFKCQRGKYNWYNLFQEARSEINFIKFSNFSTLAYSIKNNTNKNEKICLFDWNLLLCCHGSSVLKKFTLIKEIICCGFRVEEPQESSWSKCCLLCTFCRVTDKSIFMIMRFGSLVHKEYCLFISASYL